MVSGDQQGVQKQGLRVGVEWGMCVVGRVRGGVK